MRPGFALAGLCATALISGSAQAVVPKGTTTARVSNVLTALGTTKPLRTYRALEFGAKTAPAWRAFTTAAGGSWNVSWDAATGVPAQIWGSGIAVPGASSDAAIAEAAATAWLAQHVALVAPGASATDFVLAADHDDGDVRSIGFYQYAGGHRVVGGQVSFRFKRDRLFVIASEALPNVTFGSTRAAMPAAVLGTHATLALRTALALPAAPVTADGETVILPLVGDAGVIGYRLVAPFTVAGGTAGRYTAYVDPTSGAPVAAQQLNAYATGTLLYRGVERYPARGRVDRPAVGAHVIVGASTVTVGADGGVALPSDAPQTVVTSVEGDEVTVVTQASGALAVTASLPISSATPAVWDASAMKNDDAQVITYTSIIVAKDYIRTHVDANLPLIAMQLTANVNIEDQCNAFFDGNAVNFFQASDSCENTGVIADVVYHEFGHAVHAAEVIEGVGAFDYGMSEGVADYLAATITGDHEMGRGFHFDDQPLRDIDPNMGEARYPEGVGEVHTTGLIISGVLWDLRKSAIAAFGEEAGIAFTNRAYLAGIQRGVDIPSTLVEVLAEDDDDGNLDNGTPNECMIRAAYARHGMRTIGGFVVPVGDFTDADETVPVRLDVTQVSTRCPAVDAIDHATLRWKPSSRPNQPHLGDVRMTTTDNVHFTADLPLPNNAPMQYQGLVKFVDGDNFTFPDNRADPYYQLYRGDTVPLYCTDFETDPFADGWTKSDTPNESAFAWGAPTGGPTDPPAAFSGTKILAQNLGGDYAAGTESWVRLPTIDAGTWSDVRLQYRRWLGVEDSYYDHARVRVNDQTAWINASAMAGDASSLAHVDKEWRFTDLLISPYSKGAPIRIEFAQDSDPGLQFGGWQIDDLCVVANVHSICGDGSQSPTEACDDGSGNANVADACRTWCALPLCGDAILDEHEQCDAGGSGNNDCSSTCMLIPHLKDEDAGCCSTDRGTGALGAGALAGFLTLVLGRRRRRT